MCTPMGWFATPSDPTEGCRQRAPCGRPAVAPPSAGNLDLRALAPPGRATRARPSCRRPTAAAQTRGGGVLRASLRTDGHSRPRSGGAHDRALAGPRSEEHTSELQSRQYLVCRLLLEKKNTLSIINSSISL